MRSPLIQLPFGSSAGGCWAVPAKPGDTGVASEDISKDELVTQLLRCSFPRGDLAASGEVKPRLRSARAEPENLGPQSPPNSASQLQSEMRKVGLQPLVLRWEGRGDSRSHPFPPLVTLEPSKPQSHPSPELFEDFAHLSEKAELFFPCMEVSCCPQIPQTQVLRSPPTPWSIWPDAGTSGKSLSPGGWGRPTHGSDEPLREAR